MPDTFEVEVHSFPRSFHGVEGVPKLTRCCEMQVRGFHSGGRVEMEATYKGADTVGEYVLIPSVQGNAF